MKNCSKCKQLKPFECFYKDKQTSDGYTCQCKECRKSKRQEWADKNPDKQRQYRATTYQRYRTKWLEGKKQYYQENKQKIDKYKRQWIANNRERHNNTNKQWSIRNPDKVKAMAAKYRAEHKSEILMMQRQWRLRNPDKCSAKYNRRRIRYKNTSSDGTWNAELLKTIYSLPCSVCNTTENIQADHIIPLALGGANSARNCMPLCRTCNASKGAKPFSEWLATLPISIAIRIACLKIELQRTEGYYAPKTNN